MFVSGYKFCGKFFRRSQASKS